MTTSPWPGPALQGTRLLTGSVVYTHFQSYRPAEDTDVLHSDSNTLYDILVPELGLQCLCSPHGVWSLMPLFYLYSFTEAQGKENLGPSLCILSLRCKTKTNVSMFHVMIYLLLNLLTGHHDFPDSNGPALENVLVCRGKKPIFFHFAILLYLQFCHMQMIFYYFYYYFFFFTS